jgi:threonine synthase
VAGAVQLAREGKLTADDELVICITGNGLKTLDVVEGVLPESPIVEAKVRQVADLVKARG